MCIALSGAMLCLMAGCASQPSRSQTQTTTLNDGSTQSVNNNLASAIALPPIPTEGYGTNAFAQLCVIVKLQAKALSDKSGGAIGDQHSQNMMLETGGNENNSQTSTPTTTTPIDVMRGTGGGSSWAELFSGIKSMFGGGTSTNTAAADKASATAASDCADGSCSVGTTTAK